MRKLDELGALVLLSAQFPRVMQISSESELHRRDDNENRSENYGMYAYWDAISNLVMEPLLDDVDGDDSAIRTFFWWMEVCLVLGDTELQNFMRVNPVERIGDLKHWREKAVPVMGKRTRVEFDAVQEFLGRQ